MPVFDALATNLHLWRLRRTGKGYVLTLVGKLPYERESGVSTSKGVIFDCEFDGKKGRIVVKCEPENPAKVPKEELDEAIKQAADYLEDELKPVGNHADDIA